MEKYTGETREKAELRKRKVHICIEIKCSIGRPRCRWK
jgi:hypothetical protein